MNGFIDSLVARVNGTENLITPRLPGRFESSYKQQGGLLDELQVSANEETFELTNHNGMQSYSDTVSAIFDNTTSNLDHFIKNNDPLQSVSQGKAVIIASNDIDQRLEGYTHQDKQSSNEFIQPVHVNDEKFKVLFKEPVNLNVTQNANHINNPETTTFIFPGDRELKKEKDRNATNYAEQEHLTTGKSQKHEAIIPEIDVQLNERKNSEPSIRISIGRIEVRAVTASNTIKTKDNSVQKPKLSLQEYLQKRDDKA